MNRFLPPILALSILTFVTLMLVVAQGKQLMQRRVLSELRPYTGAELRGRDQYVNLGCIYCHSQHPPSQHQVPDGDRGWGHPSMTSDFVFDSPLRLGTMRNGPDLLNIGARLPSVEWHLTYLYQPRAIFAWSIMPGYPYLFETKMVPAPGDIMVVMPEGFAPEGAVVVAKPEALDLIAYLLSLDRTYSPLSPGCGPAPCGLPMAPRKPP